MLQNAEPPILVRCLESAAPSIRNSGGQAKEWVRLIHDKYIMVSLRLPVIDCRHNCMGVGLGLRLIFAILHKISLVEQPKYVYRDRASPKGYIALMCPTGYRSLRSHWARTALAGFRIRSGSYPCLL